jgi:hypothetical protein
MERIIHQADAVEWLQSQDVMAGCSFITSMPDYSEFPSLSLADWKKWWVKAAGLILSRCPEDGVVIFYQRDSKREGAWVDKAYLCQKAAEEQGVEQIWHKIVCRAPAGHITFGRPAYSHLICFSKRVRMDVSVALPDILPVAGKSTWARGMGIDACEFAIRFVKEHTQTRTVVDPFCGHGLVLAVANHEGMNAIGVELSRKRAERAREVSAASFLFGNRSGRKT